MIRFENDLQILKRFCLSVYFKILYQHKPWILKHPWRRLNLSEIDISTHKCKYGSTAVDFRCNDNKTTTLEKKNAFLRVSVKQCMQHLQNALVIVSVSDQGN